MEKARDLSKFFLAQGAEIQVVGGFVRDMILGKKTSDIDLVANCQPEVTVQILQKNHIKYRKTHISHGVIVAIMDGNYFEISSLRQDVECYGRKAKVSFVKDFALDAQRRDFTINALYLNFSGKIYDFFSGQDDLKNGIVKFIGNPQQRIIEDYLRILRFFRFTVLYGKTISKLAIRSIKNL
jgi:tRNA nucleotidyltransferase/poly(A) polymerase